MLLREVVPIFTPNGNVAVQCPAVSSSCDPLDYNTLAFLSFPTPEFAQTPVL